MTTKSRILVLASAAFLAASGLSLPALAAGTTATATETHEATTAKLPKALVGHAKSFKLEEGNALSVEDMTGGWYKIDLAKACEPLAKAKAIRIVRSRHKDRIGYVAIGRHYCLIKDFARADTEAPAGSGNE